MKKAKKYVKVKHYTTKHLKAFIDNSFVGIDGLDREDVAHEILDEYWKRTTLQADKSIEQRIRELEDYEASLPPVIENWSLLRDEMFDYDYHFDPKDNSYTRIPDLPIECWPTPEELENIPF